MKNLLRVLALLVIFLLSLLNAYVLARAGSMLEIPLWIILVVVGVTGFLIGYIGSNLILRR
jgi:hypothetical protein